jgi:hypothetical protein
VRFVRRADPLSVRIAKQAQVALAALLENEIGERVPAACSPSLCNARRLGGKGSLAALPSLIILAFRNRYESYTRSQLTGSARDILPHQRLYERRIRGTANQPSWTFGFGSGSAQREGCRSQRAVICRGCRARGRAVVSVKWGDRASELDWPLRCRRARVVQAELRLPQHSRSQ